MSKKPHVVCLLLTLGLSLTLLAQGSRLSGFSGQAARGQGAAQAPRGGSSEATARVPPANAVSVAPTVSVTDHKLTGGPIPGQCVAPVAKANFIATDAQAYQWTLVSGANLGDVLRWEFVQPGGAIYFQTATQPLTISGEVCFSAFIFIAGQAAAALPGNWQVRVIYNGAPLLTENFSVAAAPANTAALLVDDSSFENSLGYPNGAALAHFVNRLTPSSYPATLREIQIYFGNRTNGLGLNTPLVLLAAANPSGNGNIDGLSFQSFAGTVGGLNHFNVYPLPTPLTINSGDFVVGFRANNPANIFPADRDTTPPARLRSYVSTDGSDFEIIDSFGATLAGNFGIRALISSGSCPTVTGLNPASGASGSSVTITGANFTGVTAVRFANNVAATFTVNHDTTITATVPNGAVTGPITLSKPNCSDVQTGSFTVTTGVCTLKADYQFQNVLSSSVGTPPALVHLGNNSFDTATVDNTTRTVLRFAADNGVALAPTTGVVAANVYTAVVLFAFNDVGGYRRIIDLKNGTSDSGLYVHSGYLNFYPYTTDSGAPTIAPNAFVQIVLTRAANKQVSGYINGVRQFQFVDNDDAAVLDASNTLRFFRDNSNGEASAGAVARLRLYDCALSAGEVAALDRLPVQSAACPTVSGINPTSGVVGSSVTISGTNFTGVTAVKFANNVAAQFIVISATQITATVPSGATRGPLTLSKLNCADVQTPSFNVTPRPALEVLPTSLNFGGVATGQSTSLGLTVRNAGNAVLNLSSITSSDPQFTLSLLNTAFSLPAGGSVNFNVRFAPNAAGAKTATLAINSNDVQRPRVEVPLTGSGLAPALEVTPPSLSFGELRLAQTRDLSFTIRNTGAAPLKINSLTSSNPLFSVTQLLEKPANTPRNLPLTLEPNASVEVSVRFRPSYFASSVGPQNGTLAINSNDPNRPRVELALSGTGLGPLIAVPSSLAFGSITVCQSTPATVSLTVTNTGNASLNIAALALDNQAFSLTPRPALPLSLAPGASTTLNLSFYTRAPGTQNGRLAISSNAVNTPGLSIALSGVGLPVPPPASGQLAVSRTTLSHGRADNTRALTPFNPFGLASVIGFVFPGGPLPANSIAPGALPPPLIGGFPGLPPAAIPTAPDPLRITLGGGVANPIVLAAANIPSCFTLVVAEGVTVPDLTRWERIGTRFGSGNLYATVAIPGTAIFPGMELVTEEDLNAYTANSIIFEAPDFGLLAAPAGQNGGVVPLQARARRIPPDPQCQTLLGAAQSVDVEFSRTVRIEILADGLSVTRNGDELEVTVTAQISGNFDPALNTVVRWAYDGNSFDEVVDDPDLTPPGAARVLRRTFRVPASDECKLATITVVASSTGNLPPALLPPLNPFLEIAPDTIGLFTFRSGGCTVEDTKTVLVRVGNESCGGGVPSGWLQGVVTNALTGAPIAGATVSVAGTNISALTADDGSYELNNVPAGQQTLNASADGFAPAQVQVNVTAGQVVTRNISLLPLTGTLRGFVINAFNNQPIAGATVAVKGTSLAASSGGDGSYTLINVPIGEQTVDATAPGFDPAQASVTIGPDQIVTQDFFLMPMVGTIRGVVRNATNSQPIAGATITVAGTSLSATSGADGSYTLDNVPVGPQTLNATADGFNPAGVSASVSAGATINQDIAMQPLLGTLTGVISNADNGDTIAGATITVGGTGRAATSGADGSYTLSNVPAGAQTLNVSANGFVTMQRPGVNVIGNNTIVQDFALAPLTGMLRGRVTDLTTNQPIANAQIELLPFPLSFANTDAGGNYTLTNVPTGQQVILATAPGYFAKLAVVNVLANQTVTQDFELRQQLGTVLGSVYDRFSQPVAGATVAVAGTNIATRTAADGTYTLSGVPVGTKTLNVSATGFTATQATVNVVANESVFKGIYLETPTGAVRGTVRNAANNQPIAGAQLLVGVPFGPIFYSAFTDAAGNYALNDIPASSFTLYVSAGGFQPAQADVTVVANQTTTQNFALQPDAPAAGAISGTVRSTAAGNPPVDGATISVAGTSLSTTSGANGGYTLSNVTAGAQTLNVSKAGFRAATVPVIVTAGQAVTQDIALTPDPGTGTVTGTVRNAATGNALDGATITVAGTSLAATSGANGVYTLNNVPAGTQTLNAARDGFVATTVPVTVTAGQTTTQNISLSPTLQQGEIRILLNWTKDGDGHPRDLDAHLIGPNPDGSCFHVFYDNVGSLNAAPFARLEVDNIRVSGDPPTETIRIARLSPGIYRFYVDDFRREKPDGLSRSRATVQIIGSSGQLGSFTVPSGTGGVWTVFEINGQTGAVTAINRLEAPASSCR